jgi:predicted MFS family arabinose efflux permease
VEQRRYNRPGSIAAMIMLSNPAGLAMACTPGIVTVFAREGTVSARQATMLGSCELAGMTLALILASLVLSTIDRRRLAFGAVIAAVLGHVLLLVPGSYPQILACQFLAGLGEGVMAAVAVAAIAGTEGPDRLFALNVASNLIASSLFFVFLPHLTAGGGVRSVECALSICAVCFGLGLPWLPRRAPSSVRDRNVSRTQIFKFEDWLPGLLGLCGTLAFLAGVGSVWPEIGQIGASRHLPLPLVSSALAAAGVAGVASALFATWLGVRRGRLFPLVLASLGLICAMLVLLVERAPELFFVDVICFMFWWIFAVPYFLGLLAALDPSGRLAAFSVAMQTCGLALGQALSAIIVGIATYSATIYPGMAFVVIALLVMLAAVRLHENRLAGFGAKVS